MPSKDAPRNPPAGSIFLCYRREDSADVTGRLYDRLVAAFDETAVFKDVDNVPFGVDFRAHIHQVIAGCRVVLVIIGSRWLEVTDQAGERRLDDRHDHVRVEIEAALSRQDVLVIPVLVQGAEMPSAGRLASALEPLAYRNGLPVRRDPDFHGDADRLIKQLRQFFEAKEAEPAPPKKLVEPAKPVDSPAEATAGEAAFLRVWTAVFIAGGMLQVFLTTLISGDGVAALAQSVGLAWLAMTVAIWRNLRARVSLHPGWMLALIAAGMLPPLIWNSFTGEDTEWPSFLVFTVFLGLVEGGIRGYVLWQGVGRQVGLWAFVWKNVGVALAAQAAYLVTEAVLLVAIARVPLAAAWTGRSLNGVTSLLNDLFLYASQDRLSTMMVLPSLAYWFVYGRRSGLVVASALQGTPLRSLKSMTVGTILAAFVALVCVLFTYAR